jgi:hypothetical protein
MALVSILNLDLIAVLLQPKIFYKKISVAKLNNNYLLLLHTVVTQSRNTADCRADVIKP